MVERKRLELFSPRDGDDPFLFEFLILLKKFSPRDGDDPDIARSFND